MATDNDILNELNELGSTLVRAPKRMPYNVPEGYFDALPDAMYSMANTQAQDTKTNPYSVPGGYFDTLPQQVLQKAKQGAVTAPEKTKGTNIWMKNIRWAAAAIFIFAVGLGSYRVLTPQTLSIQQQLDQVPESVLAAYVADNVDDFDTELITGNIQTTTTGINSVDNEDIEDYLEGWQ